MDGMLSQDEINALLNASAEESAASEPTTESNESNSGDATLTEIQCDAVGEVANICMGTSATTLNSLLNRKVNITIPSVTVTDWESLTVEYEKPCVFVQIKYTVGLDGSNMLVLKENDVKIITDLMMGGDGTNTDGELSEIHLSAISEAMNQMMGSSATSLSSMLGKIIDISPPSASLIPDIADADPG
ncbi:MAG: flagellar motor switch phosphatase FliY, partial [Eubacteriales bacterium]